MSPPSAKNSESIERSLAAKIDPWLKHMEWRSDFDGWRRKRIWQERYQSQALADVEKFAGSAEDASRALDLGAGMGGFAVAFALKQRERITTELAKNSPSPNRAIIAMDYNPAYCEIARIRASRYDLDLPTLVAAGESLPFAPHVFGTLTCWDVVEHVQEPEKLFAEISRVLTPGGRAFVTVINRLALVDPHYHLRFINWMPRALAERYITRRQRVKQSALRDRQRLGEMHYFTFGSAVALAARYGLDAQDLNFTRTRFLRLGHWIGTPIYVLWRTLGMGTYNLVLTKTTL